MTPSSVIPPLDYERLRDSLAAAGAVVTLAELHGGACGALCAGGPAAARRWLMDALDDGEIATAAAVADELEELVTTSARMLEGDELAFEPLLPSDDAPLAEQVEALAAWCQGFVNGIGSTAPTAARGSPESGALGEILRDFAEISRAGLSDDEAEGPAPISRSQRSTNTCASAHRSCSRSWQRCERPPSAAYTDDYEALEPVNAKEFARRRRHLMELVGSSGIAILAAAPERVRSRDTLYVYRQDSDFFYLTGFREPEAVAVLVPGRPQGEFLLFCRERNSEREQWDGPRAGPSGAVADFGADDAFPITDLDDILPGLLERSDRVYYSLGGHEFDQKLLSFINTLNQRRQSSHAPSELVSLGHLLHEMRLFKSRAETSVMRQAARIAAGAHGRAMRACRPGMKEYELEAEFAHEFRRHGAECSYPPIVAAGANACILHYRSNDAPLVDGDLVLIDAGCEVDLYASDLTRTFPVNGRFSAPQRELYDVVLEANRAATAKAVPGNHWNDPHDAAVGVVTRGLKHLGLLEGRVPQLVKSLAYRQFFMHKTGHWLGLDVHDVGDYKVADQWRLLEPGMVMTIEPGVYVAANDKSVDKRWRGIGIRIEDDVQVTRDEPDVLTRGVPTTVAEIEAHMNGSAA